jgi:regulatory protein YycH of two-component signal transduction system YycFG
MNKNTIIVVVLAVLVLISAVQAIQLNQLKTKIASGDIVTAAPLTTQTTSTDSSSKASLPRNLNNLPRMVGGC